MSLRILFAVHGPADPRTAVYLNVMHRAEYLRRSGHVVDVMTRADMPFKSLARLDPLLLPVALAGRGLSRYDLVLFHSYLGWAFHAARRWLDPAGRTATFTVFHGLEPIYYRALEAEMKRAGSPLSRRFRLLHQVVLPRLLKRTCRASDAVFCLNQAEAEYLHSNGWAEPARIVTVANGIEPQFIAPSREPNPVATAMLFVGQWLPAKGTRYLAQAFSRIAAARPAVRLACVGTRIAAATVLADFPREVRARVTVIPEVDRAQLSEQLRRADLFVFPSLSEGFSGALLEAMGAGLPVVATRAGAAADLLEDGCDALVVPCAEIEPLVVAIERLLGDAALRQRLGDAARERARAYTWDRVNETYLRHLLDAVARRRAVAAEHRAEGSHDVA